MPLWHGEEGSQERKNEPCENALHNPVTFPTPSSDFVDGHVATRLAERADRYYEQAYYYVHMMQVCESTGADAARAA